MKKDFIVIAALVAAGWLLISKGKIGQYVGQSVGRAVGSTTSGLISGVVQGTLIDPYTWARNYDGYIPIIDDLAKGAISIKNWGDPNSWWK